MDDEPSSNKAGPKAARRRLLMNVQFPNLVKRIPEKVHLDRASILDELYNSSEDELILMYISDDDQ